MSGEEDDRESTKSKTTPSSTDDTASERSPLLGNRKPSPRDEPLQRPEDEQGSIPWGKSVVLKLLFTSTIVSLSFGVTQVP